MIAVCTLGCDRKIDRLFGWPHLTNLSGDYRLYYNFEFSNPETARQVAQQVEEILGPGNPRGIQGNLDLWSWRTAVGPSWRRLPGFDQDQARLAPIVCARNMCIDFAMQTGASHLLFIDGDIVPPPDIIPKLLAVNRSAVGGLVYGRGVHARCPYIFGERRRWTEGEPSYTLVEVENGSIGFTMFSRKLFDAIRVRWGTAGFPGKPDEMSSEDRAFQADVVAKFGEWMCIRTDVVGKHLGDLKANEISSMTPVG
ncbi:MAG TPA: hypothetical protein VMU19_05885 [Bryobacteraceae bacterium]|nr:hypothetical protein [Bryobacteraceae bacterium]